MPSTCSSAIAAGVTAAHRATACGARQVGSSTGVCYIQPVDLDPSVEQRAIVDVFGALADRFAPLDRLRGHEPGGFSPELWEQLVAMGAPGMGVPEAAGGAGAAMLDLALAVEALGRRLAPAPLVEHAVAARVLAVTSDDVPAAVVDGAAIATVAAPAGARRRRPPGARRRGRRARRRARRRGAGARHVGTRRADREPRVLTPRRPRPRRRRRGASSPPATTPAPRTRTRSTSGGC